MPELIMSCSYDYQFESIDNHKTYEYVPLHPKQIRLLKLHPGHTHQLLEISLENYDSSALHPRYEAVSYTWGDPERHHRIKCNGALLKITASLDTVLRQMRFSHDDHVLWVDGICINQDDLNERAQQVLLMGGIYSRATKVLIWLGEVDVQADRALKILQEWASFNLQTTDTDTNNLQLRFERRFLSDPDQYTALLAVGALTYRPWFNRCWTFQEILLSADAEIMVGDLRLTWDCFHYALVAFPVYSLAEKVLNFNALFMCYSKAKIKKHISWEPTYPISISPNLSTLLQMTRNFVTSDPRDKIFSMLGLATLNDRNHFKPQYDMSVRDTYILFTLAIIRDENSLHVLSSTGGSGRDADLPSWCPDWTCKRNLISIGFDDFISYSFNSHYKPNLQNICMNEWGQIELEGALIDVITEMYDLETLADELKASVRERKFTSVLSKFARQFGLHNRMLLDDQSSTTVLLRTLSADHWFFSSRVSDCYKEQWFPNHTRCWGPLKRSQRDDFNQILMCRHSKNLNDVDYLFSVANIVTQTLPHDVTLYDFDYGGSVTTWAQIAIVKEAVDQALFLSKGRHILVTQHGLVALGAKESKIGDSLCSFWGADVPFIIRRQNRLDRPDDDTTSVHQIIGECYIDGLMYGQLFCPVERQKDTELPIQPIMDWVQLRKFKVR